MNKSKKRITWIVDSGILTKKQRWLSLSLFFLGLLLLLGGFFRGDIAAVLDKATIICLECVGIG